MISSLLWLSFQPRERERGGTNDQVSHWLFPWWIEPCCTEWLLFPVASIIQEELIVPVQATVSERWWCGGRPFTQSSRVSGAADSGLTQGSLLLCPRTRLNCKSARLEDNRGRLHSPELAPLVRLPPHHHHQLTWCDESQLNEKLVSRRHWTVPEQQRCPGRDY